MRVLVVTNMFPSPERESEGIFVERELTALSRIRPDWDFEVVFIDTVADKRAYVSGNRVAKLAGSRFAPDIVHAHYGLSALFCRWWYGPLVVTFHGSDVNKPSQLLVSRWAARRSDVRIVVSQSLGQRLGMEALVIPCGVDGRIFNPGDREASRRAPAVESGDYPVLLFPSSPARRVKDYPLFLETVERLRGQFPHLRVVCLGDVEPTSVPDYLRSADCLVLTSRREGSSVVTKEALCCGTRIVSCDVGDIAAQIDGLDGCAVVASREATALASEVEAVLSRPAPSAEEAQRRFSLGAEAEAVAAVYESVVRER